MRLGSMGMDGATSGKKPTSPKARNEHRTVVAEQVVGAGGYGVELLAGAVAACAFEWKRTRLGMVADIGYEDIQVNIAVVVAESKAHPITAFVQPHGTLDCQKAHAIFVRVVAVNADGSAVVRGPEVGVAVVVEIEEQGRPCNDLIATHACICAYLGESAVAVVVVEDIFVAACGRARMHGVHVGAVGYEDVNPTVAVYVGAGGAGAGAEVGGVAEC